MLDALIISDIHLGSRACRARELLDLLGTVQAGEIILNGDTFDSIDFRNWPDDHWQVLFALRSLGDRVVFVAGNHELDTRSMELLTGFDWWGEEYVFCSGGKKILCLHGHEYDGFLAQHPWLSWIGDQIYGALQWLDRSCGLARRAKLQSKEFISCASKVKAGAKLTAREYGFDIVCCGHTHLAEASHPYYNSGCWTESPGTYLAVKDGVVELREHRA